MMRFLTMVLIGLISLVLVGGAFAVGPGKTVEYAGGGEGKVILDGKVHADKGGKCSECHPKIWPMKKGAKITKADHVAGKSCGTCHDGKKAFDVTAKDSCGKCHKK